MDLYTPISLFCFTIATILIAAPIVCEILMQEISVKHLDVKIISAAKTKKGNIAIFAQFPDGSVKKIIKTSDFTNLPSSCKKIRKGDTRLVSIFGRDKCIVGLKKLNLVDMQ